VAGALRPAMREIGRNLIVGGALKEGLGDGEGKQIAGVSGLVAERKILRAAAHQVVDFFSIVSEAGVAGEVDEEAEIDGTGEGEDAAEGHTWGRGRKSSLRALMW